MVSGTRPALTPRQSAILDFIAGHVTAHGYPPSMREVGEACGLDSSSSVAHQLRVLEDRGYLRRDPNKSRALTVITADDPDKDQEELARLLRPWTTCDDGNGFDHGSDRAAAAVLAAGFRRAP